MVSAQDHEKALVSSSLAEHHINASEPDIALIELAHAVAAIPWGEGNTITDVLKERGTGTCTGKHRVMLEGLRQLNIEAQPVMCTFHWQEQEIAYPRELRDFLDEHHWPHAHTFLQAKNSDDIWIDVDVTWDPPLKPYGFWTFPEDWDGEQSFHGLKMLERWDGADIAAKQDELQALLSPEQQRARDHFRGLFISWVASLR